MLGLRLSLIHPDFWMIVEADLELWSLKNMGSRSELLCKLLGRERKT